MSTAEQPVPLGPPQLTPEVILARAEAMAQRLTSDLQAAGVLGPDQRVSWGEVHLEDDEADYW